MFTLGFNDMTVFDENGKFQFIDLLQVLIEGLIRRLITLGADTTTELRLTYSI